MYSDLNEELKNKLASTLAEGLSEQAMKGVKKKVDDIICQIDDDISYRLKDELAPMLATHVEEMAQKTIEALLEGNEKEMRRYLSCGQNGEWNGRSGPHNFIQRQIGEQHPIIHGSLHEQGCVLLRKKIVEAHPELLKNERILDLEDQVASLVAQVNKANAEKEAMWRRVQENA